ncbi:hypothetical protein [Streptomyces sp. Qhu_M48]|uniref:hypothetical protein n=1 Tax=Streptomyces sp. Qhu_M48 TaxID=3435889 RepID=UPI003F50AAB5
MTPRRQPGVEEPAGDAQRVVEQRTVGDGPFAPITAAIPCDVPASVPVTGTADAIPCPGPAPGSVTDTVPGPVSARMDDAPAGRGLRRTRQDMPQHRLAVAPHLRPRGSGTGRFRPGLVCGNDD